MHIVSRLSVFMDVPIFLARSFKVTSFTIYFDTPYLFYSSVYIYGTEEGSLFDPRVVQASACACACINIVARGPFRRTWPGKKKLGELERVAGRKRKMAMRDYGGEMVLEKRAPKRLKLSKTKIQTDGMMWETHSREDVAASLVSARDGMDYGMRHLHTDVLETVEPLQELHAIDLDVPVPLSEIQAEHARPDEACWGCVYRFDAQKRPGENPSMDLLYNEYMSNKESMTLEELAKLIANAHEKYIYVPSVKEGKPTLFWSYSAVLRHLTYHMTDTRSMILHSIKEIHTIGQKLTESLFVNRGGKVDPDPSKIKIYESVARLKLMYIDKYNGK